jgi:hypothetical protein
LPPALSFLPKFHSGMKLEGLGKSCSFINLEGSADIGVAISFRSLSPFCCEGGGGRANGFRGPVAPADNSADADGDGGGNRGPSLIGVKVLFGSLGGLCVAGELAEADFGVLSDSSSSNGICTFSRGRFASEAILFVLDGGMPGIVEIVGVELVL